jgi:hypothetical protein
VLGKHPAADRDHTEVTGYISLSKGIKGGKMQTLTWLAHEIPWVMAPAAIIATTAAISLAAVLVRSTELVPKAMAIGVMIAITVGIMLMEAVP